MSGDGDQALWRAAFEGDAKALIHALVDGKKLRCVGGKEYSPAMSIGGTSQHIRGYGFEKHQHHHSHDKESPPVIHTTTSKSVLNHADRQHITLRTRMHPNPDAALQFQYLKTYNSTIAKKHHDLTVASTFGKYERWDELGYDIVDEKFQHSYTRDYVYPGKNGRTALHIAKSHKIIEILLEAGWSPNMPDHDGNTPGHLHIYADPETSEILVPACLIAYGCDMKLKNYDGERPMQYFESKNEKKDTAKQSKQWTREYKKWIHNKSKYPKPQTDAVYKSALPKKDYLDRKKPTHRHVHEVVHEHEDEYGMAALVEFEDLMGARHHGEIVDVDEDAKEYTIQYKNDGYDIETKVHFKDVLGHSDAYD